MVLEVLEQIVGPAGLEQQAIVPVIIGVIVVLYANKEYYLIATLMLKKVADATFVISVTSCYFSGINSIAAPPPGCNVSVILSLAVTSLRLI